MYLLFSLSLFFGSRLMCMDEDYKLELKKEENKRWFERLMQSDEDKKAKYMALKKLIDEAYARERDRERSTYRSNHGRKDDR